MTDDQWQLVPDLALSDGPRLLLWLADRGIRPPSLLDVEHERLRRGLRRRRPGRGAKQTTGDERRQTKEHS